MKATERTSIGPLNGIDLLLETGLVSDNQGHKGLDSTLTTAQIRSQSSEVSGENSYQANQPTEVTDMRAAPIQKNMDRRA